MNKGIFVGGMILLVIFGALAFNAYNSYLAYELSYLLTGQNAQQVQTSYDEVMFFAILAIAFFGAMMFGAVAEPISSYSQKQGVTTAEEYKKQCDKGSQEYEEWKQRQLKDRQGRQTE